MKKISHPSTNSPMENDEGKLLSFIRQYSVRIGEHKSSADLSCALLEMGTKTEFAQQMEETLINPIEAMSGIKKNVDKEVLQIVDRLFRLFIAKAKEDNLVESAFKRKNTGAELRYGIILKEDTFEKRDSVFGFLNFYYGLDLSEQVPVHFQFVPSTIKDKIAEKEYIA